MLQVIPEAKAEEEPVAEVVGLETPKPSSTPTARPTAVPTVKPTPQPSVKAEAKGSVREIAYNLTVAKWGADQWPAMELLIKKESGFNPYAMNPSSGACGLPQSLPCSKLLNKCGSLDNHSCQVQWMVDYVSNRYGTPQGAIAFHAKNNWY
jgi:hypothetical protein